MISYYTALGGTIHIVVYVNVIPWSYTHSETLATPLPAGGLGRETLAPAIVFNHHNSSSWLFHFSMSWLLLPISEFFGGVSGRQLAPPAYHYTNQTQIALISLGCAIICYWSVGRGTTKSSLQTKCRISGLQRSLGSGRFIEHQITFLAKQVELLWLRGRLQQHTFTLLPQW